MKVAESQWTEGKRTERDRERERERERESGEFIAQCHLVKIYSIRIEIN